MAKRIKVAIFRKNRNIPTKRKLVRIDYGKSVEEVVNYNLRAGEFTSGKYVAFEVVQGGYKIDGIPVAYEGYAFEV